MTARFRLGSKNRSNKYWLKEEDKKFKLCGLKWMDIIEGGKDNLAAMHRVRWARKRREKETEDSHRS